ncbi:hypothetical protein ID853_02450 [Xenorhabdus sp. Vera]|uniref:hypothetical protein n=1 Tax=Xenorhabdus koppenhoeferi TaxID=351659 RepID=UPI0019AFF36E|nr:hypothetical protein [Xenorhabdus sp. Vera]MBD2809774.1 hypothetical protein [Xenorhabdus sp. Vera]
MKTNLYIIIFIILFFVFKANSTELIEGKTDNNDIHNEAKNNHLGANLSQYYNTTFESLNAYDDLEIKVASHQCMYNSGDGDFILRPKDIKAETLEDSNAFFGGCAGVSKYVIWEIKSKSQSCNIQLITYLPSSGAYFVWQTVVNVDTDNCPFEITAYCNEGNCLNHHVNSSDTNEPNKIAITIKNKNEWNPPKITFPPWGYQVANNYITFTGKGLMENGHLPVITTNFNEYIYATQFTGSAEDWKGQLWIDCGITGAIRIDGVENSDVTFNGPPCGATITSIQDGQIIPAGKYSLSGIVNSDTADDDRRMQVQITGYQNDGTIYSPTKSYTPNVDTGTGKWNLDGLEAVCFIHYKASVSSNFELQSTNQSLLPEISGKKEISYSTSPCPIELTEPKNHEVVSSTTVNEQNIFIGGKATDGTIIVNVKSADSQGNFEQSFRENVVDNKWSVEAENVPIGIMKIQAKNSDSTEFPSKNDNAEVTILSSKIFSVEANNINVFTKFSGTSMPEVEDEDLMPEVKILLYENQLEEAFTNEYGDWVTKKKYYAKRGEYNFTFQEESNSEIYKSRDKKILKCTGSDRGMICVK